MAKKGQIFKKYSPEFKFNVILDMRTNGLSYHETVRKYELRDDRIGGTRQMVQRWERIYLEEGIEKESEYTMLFDQKVQTFFEELEDPTEDI